MDINVGNSRMTLLHGYTAEGLERQYNVRIARPDFDSHVVPGWTRRCSAFRAAAECKLDLAYGVSPREKFDFFPATGGKNGPVLVFFHGGYWQRLDKSFFSFVAEPFVKNGVSVVLANYDLCPSVRISQIPPQARRAVAWVWRNADELGYDKDRLYVMGHSAGGHITAMVMATDWQALGNDLPRDLVKGGIPISGLFELEPLRHTSINNALGMDEAEAASQSPMHYPPATDAPQLVVCGGAEPNEFHRQSDIYAHTFATPARQMERYTVPGRDHMNELDDLAEEKSTFFQKALHLITA